MPERLAVPAFCKKISFAGEKFAKVLDLRVKIEYNMFIIIIDCYAQREDKMNTSVKSILATAACAAALFIPSYVAIANYVMAQNAPVDSGSVSVLEISDIDGKVFTLSADDPAAKADISRFIELNDAAIEQTSLPEPLVGNDYFEFKYYSYDRVSVYRYYFTDNPNEAYYVDSAGKAYRITEADAAQFLSTTYARCLYDTTEFPVMTISSEKVAPVSADWAYQAYGGDFIMLDDLETASPTEKIYPMKGAFALSFDVEPDFLTVEITDGGTVVYNDLYANIANAALEGKNIDVTVNAKWYQSEERACYGEAVYKFKAKILLPAVFYMGETSVEPGEFVAITAKNVDDPSAVTFASEPDIGYTPKFFSDGSYVRALIPISWDFAGSGVDSIKLTFSYGEVTQEMILDLEPKTFGTSTMDISPAIVYQSRSETTLKAFADATDPLLGETSSTPLWEGAFLEGLDAEKLAKGKSAFLKRGFGRTINISATGESYRNDGVDYVALSGEPVLAVNNGTVVYAGYLEYSGYTVIIDHGLGLKSWYYNMSSSNVTVGQAVSKGDTIGNVGSTGFTPSAGLHVRLTVFDVPVCPYSLWENGIVMSE